MTRYPCPFLRCQVELTQDRERHIAERHPDLLPEHADRRRSEPNRKTVSAARG